MQAILHDEAVKLVSTPCSVFAWLAGWLAGCSQIRIESRKETSADTESSTAIYTIFTSPDHPPVPDHLPTLIVTPSGKPAQILYTYLVCRSHNPKHDRTLTACNL